MSTTTNAMADYEIRNARFAALRLSAGLGTAGTYEVRSNSTLTGAYNVVGRTDDISLACQASEALAAQATPCEAFTANVALLRTVD